MIWKFHNSNNNNKNNDKIVDCSAELPTVLVFRTSVAICFAQVWVVK